MKEFYVFLIIVLCVAAAIAVFKAAQRVVYKKLNIQKKKATYSVLEKKRFPFVYLFLLLIPTLYVAVFYFYVHASSFILAFQDEYGNFSLQYIKEVFNSFVNGKDYIATELNPLEMLRNSVFLWLNIHLVGFGISIVTGFILTKHMALSKFFRIAYQIPTIVGAVVFSRIMQQMYYYDGPITMLVQKMGVKLPYLAQENGLLGTSATAFKTLMIQAFVLTVSGGSMIIAGAFMKIPEEIFESAKLEGCGLFREAFQIAIPCIWPTISTLMVFSLCSVFTCDYAFYLYSDKTGKNGIVSIGYLLYRYNATVANNPTGAKGLYNYSSAFGIVITVITIPVVLAGRAILAKLNENVEF